MGARGQIQIVCAFDSECMYIYDGIFVMSVPSERRTCHAVIRVDECGSCCVCFSVHMCRQLVVVLAVAIVSSFL